MADRHRSKSKAKDHNNDTNNDHDHENDIKEKKRKKQIKRMNKILSTIWDESDSIYQDGSGSDGTTTNDDDTTSTLLKYLINVGEMLDNDQSYYYKIGRHGWEYFAKDIINVYYRHVIHQTKYATNAMKHIEKIKKIFHDVHVDLETMITNYCNDNNKEQYDQYQKQLQQLHTELNNNSTTTSKSKSRSTNTTTTTTTTTTKDLPTHSSKSLSGSKGKGTTAASSTSEYAEKEEQYIDLLHTFVQEQLPDHDIKKAKQLLLGFRCRVSKKSNTTNARYDVSYYNQQNRRFRSRLDVGRFLQLISDDTTTNENDDDNDTHSHNKKRNDHMNSTTTSSSSTKTPLKRRRITATNSNSNSTSTIKLDQEKKKIRQEIDKLRKVHHRATKALDDYMMNNNNNNAQTTSNNNTNTATTTTTNSSNGNHHTNSSNAEYPIDDRLLLLLNNNNGNNMDTDHSEHTMMNGHHNNDTTMKIDPILRRKPDRIEFPNVPIYCTPEIIMTWDFLCTFHRALSLLPIEMDDYVNAITYIPPYGQVGDDVVTTPVYIVEAHLAILKLLLQDRTSDDWWWSILETEVLDNESNNNNDSNTMNHTNTNGDDDDEGADNNKNDYDRPVIRIDMAATLSEIEDPLITTSWLTTLEKVLNDKNIATKRKLKLTNAIRTCLQLVTNKWIASYLRKSLLVCKLNGPLETQQAIRWLVYHVRAARPDLGERGVQQSVVLQARDKVIQTVQKQMDSLSPNAPVATIDDMDMDYDDEESDEDSDDDDDMIQNQSGTRGENGNDSERPASVIPPKPLPTLVDLLLPPSKPQYNAEFVDAFSWSHIAGATAIRILHRKKRILNETDDAIRAAHALPHLTVSERREREKIAASRILTEVEKNDDESILEKAALFLCNGGNYLDLSTQERLCILRILIEASYDSNRVYDVVSGNYKQRTSAMKALEVEQRRAKREAKEKLADDEAAARQRLAANVRKRFLNEQREEIRKLNDKSKEFSDDVIESLTDEDIIEFDDDIKADYEALPGPESFSKIEVNQMIVTLLEEAAFETNELKVLTYSELLEKEKRELEELEGRFAGFGGESALMDVSLDRDTIRTLQGLRREVERARTAAQTLPDLRANAMTQLKDALDDGRIKVLRTAYNVAKKAKLVGADDETGGVWALDLMRDAALELEKAKQNKRVLDAQKDLVAKRNKCFIRTEPMGRDRCGTRFWSFSKKTDDGDGDDGTVWVETEFGLRNEKDSHKTTSSGCLDLVRDSKSIYFGASDMEDDFVPYDRSETFLHFSRCEYHSSGLSAHLALQHWGCHATEESLRSLIKSLDSRGIRENELKIKLKEILEETLGSGDSEKSDLLVPRNSDEVDTDDTEVDRIRYDGDEGVFIEAKDAASSIDNVDTDAFDELYSGIGVDVRIRQVIDPNKDPPVARYENGKVNAWKLCINRVEVENKDKDDTMNESDTAQYTTVENPLWRIVSERGRIIWLTGEELMESLSRYKKWNQGQGYFENDSSFFLYRNTLGKYCGKNSEAAYAASPYYFAKVMLKKEAELYPKLKTRNMENSWSGQNGARALWTNSMKDYAYDFQTVKQGLLTLENALFELTGSFTDYPKINTDDDDDDDTTTFDVESLLKDPSTAYDIELESIEKNLPGLWNSPKVRAIYIYIVEQSKTTGFLALALDLLCRNTMKYLQTHNLLNVRGGGGVNHEYNHHHYVTSSSADNSYAVQSSRTTRRMNAWQQQQQQQLQGMYY